jgi:hypothetical protein
MSKCSRRLVSAIESLGEEQPAGQPVERRPHLLEDRPGERFAGQAVLLLPDKVVAYSVELIGIEDLLA